jgi:hypothetical protein
MRGKVRVMDGSCPMSRASLKEEDVVKIKAVIQNAADAIRPKK